MNQSAAVYEGVADMGIRVCETGCGTRVDVGPTCSECLYRDMEFGRRYEAVRRYNLEQARDRFDAGITELPMPVGDTAARVEGVAEPELTDAYFDKVVAGCGWLGGAVSLLLVGYASWVIVRGMVSFALEMSAGAR